MDILKVKIGDQWVGIPAIKGDTGDTGDTGAQGATGPQGPKGDTGESGVYIGESEPSDPNATLWIDPDENPTVPVQDVKVNGSSVVNNGVANVPLIGSVVPGVSIFDQAKGIYVLNNDGILRINASGSYQAKNGTEPYRPIVPSIQHESAFYGLAKAAGNSDQSSSSNAVGVYTPDALVKIQKMLGLWTPKFYIKYTLDEDGNSISSNDLPFNDVELNIYEELVFCVYQSDTTQSAFASNDFVYFTVRDAVNNGYINVSGMYLKGTKNCSVMRIRRIPNAVIAELINDGICYTKAFPKSLDYVDKIRWVALSAANGTIKAGTTVEAYIHRFI